MSSPLTHEIGETLGSMPPEVSSVIEPQVQAAEFHGCIESWSGNRRDDAVSLLDLASGFAVAPVSGFRVGAVAIGENGKLYPGANMEFADAPLCATLHAEQSAVLNAWIHGEKSITGVAVTARPCGVCRQFLCELPKAADIEIYLPGEDPVALCHLFPSPFGTPREAGESLLDSEPMKLDPVGKVHKMRHLMAVEEAQNSYCPYTRSPEGFIIGTSDGSFFQGRTAESVAFNSGIPAFVCALNQRNISASRNHTIMSAANARLITSLTPQKKLAKAVLSSIAKVSIDKILLEPS